VTEIDWERVDRYQLIKWLLAHVYLSAGARHHENAAIALARQSTETLRNMVAATRKAEVEREEKRRAQRAERKANEHQHTTTRGAR
jgi:DNA-binding phage protein